MANSPNPVELNLGKLIIYGFTIFLAIGLIVELLQWLLPMLVVIVPLGGGLWYWIRDRQLKQKQQAIAQAVFYQLVRDHQGRITLLDFAMTANLPAAVAQQFLNQKAKEFTANFEVTENGEILYCFHTLKTKAPQPQVQAASAETPVFASSESITDIPHSLTQAELARRLNVSASAISRKKLAFNFPDWTKTQDPDAIAWSYSTETQRFYSLRNSE